MEGLLIDAALAPLRARLPARPLAWRFLDAHTAVLPLVPQGAVWLWMRPPSPRLALLEDTPADAGPTDGFQAMLAARATGRLTHAEQPALDRLVRFRFAADEGFVRGEPVTLVAEFTGRNANLILLDDRDVILGASREVGASTNRFRQVRPGLAYVPPPPYDKLDPRTASRDELAEALRGRAPGELRRIVDGVGPELTRALLARADLDADETLEGHALERVLDAFEALVADPLGVAALGTDADLPAARRRMRREARQKRVRARLEHALGVTRKRLHDADRTIAAAERTAELRHEGDLLLAHAHEVPKGEATRTLTDFDGTPRTLTLDPALDAAGNAEARYAGARKRERRAAEARRRRARLEAEADDLARRLEGVEALDDEALAELEAAAAPAKPREGRRGPGLRYEGPHGFTVLVGRNARDNDAVTFRAARSRDVWLHAQGWEGSHVVILAENLEVPFDTILFAAQLAAGHSKAAGGDNVPVDYTLRKHVWRVKGAPPGAVRFTQQKTVYVTPSRDPAREAARDG